jgi:NADPH:quinone reductase-like Zn-dependent oxidoreductase
MRLVVNQQPILPATSSSFFIDIFSNLDYLQSNREGSTFVTIGGLPNRHVMLPTGLLIFKDINCRGFWVDRWIQQHSVEERRKILEELISMVKQGTLKFNLKEIPFTEYTRAIKESKVSDVVLKF